MNLSKGEQEHILPIQATMNMIARNAVTESRLSDLSKGVSICMAGKFSKNVL